MSAASRAALGALLTTDPQFVADMQALGLGSTGNPVVPKVLHGTRRFQQIGQENYPCWITHPGDLRGASAANDGGDPDGLVLNSTQQDWIDDVELALVWHQQDFEDAGTQLDGVLPPLVRLLLRNPGLSDTCTIAFVQSALPDRGENHPTHSIAFTVRCFTSIQRGA